MALAAVRRLRAVSRYISAHSFDIPLDEIAIAASSEMTARSRVMSFNSAAAKISSTYLNRVSQNKMTHNA